MKIKAPVFLKEDSNKLPRTKSPRFCFLSLQEQQKNPTFYFLIISEVCNR